MSNRPTLSSGDRKRFLSSAFKSFGSARPVRTTAVDQKKK